MPNNTEAEIRVLVRELLRDIIQPEALGASPSSRTVSVANAVDLQHFATLVLDLAKDPIVEQQIRSGRMRFEPDSPVPSPAQAAAATVGPSVLRIEKGAVTEKIIARAAAGESRIILGRRAVITPLAKEAARKLGVGIERSS